MKTEETGREKKRKISKMSISKHEIAFLNFLIAFLILAIPQFFLLFLHEALIRSHNIKKFANVWHSREPIYDVELIIDKSGRSKAFCEKAFLKIFGKFTGKGLCQSLLLNKVASHRYFSVTCKIFKSTFL